MLSFWIAGEFPLGLSLSSSEPVRRKPAACRPCKAYTDLFLADSCAQGFPGGTSGDEPACQCRRRKRHGFDPWVGKIPRRRVWPPTPVFLPGKSHGWGGRGSQRLRHDWAAGHSPSAQSPSPLPSLCPHPVNFPLGEKEHLSSRQCH